MKSKFKIKKIIYGAGVITSIIAPVTMIISCGSTIDKMLIELNREAKRIDKIEEWKKQPPSSSEPSIPLNKIHEYINDPALDSTFSIEPIKVDKLLSTEKLPITFKLWKDGYEKYAVHVIVYYAKKL